MTNSLSSGRMKIVLFAVMGAIAVSFALGSSPARAEYTVQAGLSYSSNSPANPSLNQLDIYQPAPASPDLRPVVIYAHGGGWMNGDKQNKLNDKIKLFTDAGYVFASVNYRLSPDIGPGSPTPDPGRLKFPVHPQDVGEAISWVADHADEYGGDPDSILLIGHSAGAHLVSLVGSDPSYLNTHGTSLKQVLGVIPLDAGALNVTESATQTRPQPTDNNYLIWNAFGTPAEEASAPLWAQASPVTFADSSDPRQLLITQAAAPVRIADNENMAAALGQERSGVLREPLDHEGINAEVGSPTDPTGETAAIMSFIADRIASRVDPKASINKRPSKVIRVGRKRNGKLKQRQVSFAFTGSGDFEGFQCRMNKAIFKSCASPRKYWVGGGSHSFRVRPLFPSGRPGTEKLVKFTVKAKKTRHHKKHR